MWPQSRLVDAGRRAGGEPKQVQPLDANVTGGILPATRTVLRRVAVAGLSFDTDEFVALSGLPEGAPTIREFEERP